MTQQINVLHIAPDIGPASFGIGEVVLNLTRAQNDQGCEARIWCVSQPKDLNRIYETGDAQRNWIRTFPTIGPAKLAFSPSMVRCAVNFHGGQRRVVHQHGIWTACSHVTNILHQRHDLPYVVAPHGFLDSWALRRSHWKKHLTSIAYQDANLRSATCLHALADAEVAGFRSYGLSNPVAIIPNGISNSWLESSGDFTKFKRQFGIPPDTRVMLFLSRITPKKGLPMLLEAMAMMREQLSNWQLVVAGVNEFGHEVEVKALVDRLQLGKQVSFVGPAFGQAKRDAFAAADLFVLPTHSEGAPLVVLEALGAGVPVLTTKGTPWQDLVYHRCGWWTDIRADAIRESLSHATHLTKHELSEMGMRGKTLVTEKYSWSKVGQMTIALYEWLLKRGPQPSFVHLS